MREMRVINKKRYKYDFYINEIYTVPIQKRFSIEGLPEDEAYALAKKFFLGENVDKIKYEEVVFMEERKLYHKSSFDTHEKRRQLYNDFSCIDEN